MSIQESAHNRLVRGWHAIRPDHHMIHDNLIPTMFRRKANGIIRGRRPVENDLACKNKYSSKSNQLR